jgi:pyruvate dehydrogenase phosphatase
MALHEHLVPYVLRELAALSPSGDLSDVTSQNIDRAMKDAFLRLDNDIMGQGAEALGPSFLNDAMSQLGPAYAGSCALVSYYHSDSELLKVACTGDSRAVLGRRNASGGLDTIPLSTDQTGKNPDEIARLQTEHPNEPEMLKDGRVLQLAVSRAFGDSRFKWGRKLQEQARDRFFGPRIIEPLISPPYITAEPVITTTKIEPEKGDFVIMASDGLWDNLTNEQAVGLVGRWLEEHDPSKPAAPPDLAIAPASTAQPLVSVRRNPDPSKAYTMESPANEKHFVVRDESTTFLVHFNLNSLETS